MRAWQMTAIGDPIKLVELDDASPGPDEVLLTPRAAGLCHSDIGYLDGTLTKNLARLPIVLGHEIAGTISELGSRVTEFAVGDAVAVLPALDGPGSGMDGGYATRVVVPAKYLVRIPEGVAFEDAAVGTDAGATSHRAIATVAGVRAGMKVGIIGAGGLGYLGIQHAAALGATVYVAEISPAARRACADLPVSGWASSIAEFEDEKLDVIVDFAGFGTTTSDAVRTVRPEGTVVVVGLGRNEALISTEALVVNQVTVKGSLGGRLEDVEAVLHLLSAGKLKPLVTMIGFDEIGDGLERLKRGEVRGRLAARIA